jgi:hypothetical protein
MFQATVSKWNLPLICCPVCFRDSRQVSILVTVFYFQKTEVELESWRGLRYFYYLYTCKRQKRVRLGLSERGFDLWSVFPYG